MMMMFLQVEISFFSAFRTWSTNTKEVQICLQNTNMCTWSSRQMVEIVAIASDEQIYKWRSTLLIV